MQTQIDIGGRGRCDIEVDLEPFKGLLLGIFFITVGADLDAVAVLANIGWILAGVVALFNLTGQRGNAWYLLTAGAFVSIIVPLVVFLSLQRYFVRGLLAGSVKG